MLVAHFQKRLITFGNHEFCIFPVFFCLGRSNYQFTVCLKLIAQANPYTYGVDILKHGILVLMEGRLTFP